MKRGIRFLILVLALATSYRTYAEGEHWTWNMNQYNSNATFVSVLSIDGVVQRSDQLEIGAFHDGECRGSVICVYDSRTDYYYAYLTMNGEKDMEITFRLYDHATESELDVTCDVTYSFVPDGFLGSPSSPFVFPFTTNPVERVFKGTVDALWSKAANWEGNTLPTERDIAIIDAVCQLDQNAKVFQLIVNDNQALTIPEGFTLTASSIVSDAAAKLVVAEGGQLVSDDMEGVFATIKKSVEGYGEGTGKWCFIASPLVGGSSHQSVGNLVNAAGYDLYAFDQTHELEWLNFKDNDLTLNPGEGYLYANTADAVLEFSGELNSTVTNVSLSYGVSYTQAGWNLVGNPFTYDVYADRSYYVLDGEGAAVDPVPASEAQVIKPCTGVLVKASSEGETVAFSANEPSGKRGGLRLTVSSEKRGAASDYAIVSFNPNDALAKFIFSKDAPQLAIPKDGNEYAIATAEWQGEMPIRFKPNENGTYTLGVAATHVDMAYLHLIDHLTGVEVDLLESPSYTFDARVTDFATRFNIVFVAGPSEEDVFALYDGAEWHIYAEGEAELQVLDMNGRLICSETICGNTARNFDHVSAGVYVMRLVNEKETKTQKIIVR
jgi:hypothetical protein